MSQKNTLTIRLSESVVFLRDVEGGGRRPDLPNTGPTSLLRGLLILDLAKPTRISSIEIDLTGKVATSWPEGVGSRRIDVSEEHKIFKASTVFFCAGSTPSSRRPASVGPGLAFYHDEEEPHESPNDYSPGVETPRNNGTTSGEHDPPSRIARRSSVDSFTFQRDFISHRENNVALPTPPYTPTLGSPTPSDRPPLSATSSNPSVPTIPPEDTPAQTLEEFRNALRADLEEEQRSPSHTRNGRGRSSINNSSASSLYSIRDHDHSLSRRPSIDDVPEDEPTRPQRPSTSSSPPPSPRVGSEDRRGRKNTRFSFTAVSNVFLDAVKDQVRSISPRTRSDRDGTLSREQSRDRALSRGRTLEPRQDKGQQHKKSSLGKFGEILKLDGENKAAGDGWKEFKKGVYTYPISFIVPGNAPPTLQTTYGNVSWRLKGQVHRPGAFSVKLTATREVTLIAAPGEDDTEDTENIIIERQWDSQLQYLISISGRSFYIGGTIPVQITMLPMAKMKVHRISVILEERTDYFTGTKRIARTDPIQRIALLSLKSDNKDGGAILPLISDDSEAFKHSPFYAALNPEDDPSSVAASLMGPGPWAFHHDLRLPNSCTQLNFSNKNRRAYILVTHNLKVIFRVERGDDEFVDQKSGKRKLFDIVVQTPVHILSCRCNPEWTSLPRYTELLHDDCTTAPPACPCGVKVRSRSKARASTDQRDLLTRGVFNGLDRIASRQSTDSASTVETSPINRAITQSLRRRDSLYDRNTQFERLVSGQESEVGEAPPAYDMVATSTAA